jgi:hypothetical protein
LTFRRAVSLVNGGLSDDDIIMSSFPLFLR